MNSVADHYARLLGPIYLWMSGGAEAALRQGAAELTALNVPRVAGGHALDLGAGFGMHAIALARLGYTVTAIDSSGVLLSQLRRLSEGLSIRPVESDLLEFPKHIEVRPSLILCMGDTLTHLSSAVEVESLCHAVAGSLAPGGRFVATLRDYSRPVRGDARFIAVRSDADRIHTCFLEEEGERMLVHDIVHERQGDAWVMRVSHYPKLRLEPDRIAGQLRQLGLSVGCGPGPRGMSQIIAAK